MPFQPERMPSAGAAFARDQTALRGDATRLDIHRRTEEITPPSGAPTVVVPGGPLYSKPAGIAAPSLAELAAQATSPYPHPVTARSRRRRPVLPWRRPPLNLHQLRARQQRRHVRHERRVDLIREVREYVLLAAAVVGAGVAGLMFWLLYALMAGRIDVNTLMGW